MFFMKSDNTSLSESLKTVFFLGSAFIFFSLVIPYLVPRHWILPDLGLVLTLYGALFLSPGVGMSLAVFAGAYMGAFSSSPIKYIVFYGLIFEGIRLVSSYIQMKTLGYLILLSFVLEFLLGSVFALEIYLAQGRIYPVSELIGLVLYQSLLTAVIVCPLFWIFNIITFRHFALSNRPAQ